MIERKQVLARIKALSSRDRHHILEIAARLIDSGAIDLEDYDNDYRLPKIILHTVYQDMQHWRCPMRAEDLKTVKNLENF